MSHTQLVNKLNYLHFRNTPLKIRFRHTTLPRGLVRDAWVAPCGDGPVTYTWQTTPPPQPIPPQFTLRDILIDDGDGLIRIRPRQHRLTAQGGVFCLPPGAQHCDARRSRRFPCPSVPVALTQNGACFHGRLVDFNASHLRVHLELAPPQSPCWITEDTPVQLVIGEEEEIAFAGACRIVGRRSRNDRETCLLAPLDSEIHRFKRKRHRSRRVRLSPAPALFFTHPLTGCQTELTVHEASGAGFSVETPAWQDVLLPGMIIGTARLVFADGTAFRCRLQVVNAHRRAGGDPPVVHGGLAILDMPSAQHTRLLALLYRSSEPKAFINHPQNMDALWRFFFDTGFLYPEKYAFFHRHKQRVQATYETLYTRHPGFARHFTYQRLGRVLAHMSMLRFYTHAWMIQHHAADTVANYRAGLIVLEQIGRFINDSHRLQRIRMRHVFCLFRPQNRFPSRVFGGAVDRIADRRVCSKDTFAYLPPEWSRPAWRHPVGGDWRLAPAKTEDLAELNAFYGVHSGGLLLDAFDLTPDGHDIDALRSEYQAIGFRRERREFALRRGGRPVAVFAANRADYGLNMSDLTNAVQIFVIDALAAEPEVIHRALARIGAFYPDGPGPVMVYPAAAAARIGLPPSKEYTAWVLNLEHTDSYFDYISRLVRVSRRLLPAVAPRDGGS